jgi:hypothetical protein
VRTLCGGSHRYEEPIDLGAQTACLFADVAGTTEQHAAHPSASSTVSAFVKGFAARTSLTYCALCAYAAAQETLMLSMAVCWRLSAPSRMFGPQLHPIDSRHSVLYLIHLSEATEPRALVVIYMADWDRP